METQERKIPTMMTLQQTVEKFFQHTISPDLLGQWVREGHIPHHRVGGKMGKILFDLDVLIQWWDEQIKKSTSKRNIK
jgi:hypothetical protein